MHLQPEPLDKEVPEIRFASDFLPIYATNSRENARHFQHGEGALRLQARSRVKHELQDGQVRWAWTKWLLAFAL
jgi:hypothetical protein